MKWTTFKIVIMKITTESYTCSSKLILITIITKISLYFVEENLHGW
jgi:hypothetical protein